MKNYFELLNEFFLTATIRKTKPEARLTYLTILYKWNVSRRPSAIRISDRELICLTNLNQRQITNSKRYLKNIGVLDFTATKNGGTLYNFERCTKCGTSVAENGAEPLITVTQNVTIIKKNAERARAQEEGNENGIIIE